MARTQLEKSAPATPDKALANGLSTLWVRARVWWASLQARAAHLGGRIAGPARVAWWADLLYLMLRTDWRTLYANLDGEDARQIGTTLTQAQIPFDVTADGVGHSRGRRRNWTRRAWRPRPRAPSSSGRLGFELFDKPNWVGSEFDEQVNYQRALEGELEHTVSSLSDVESARVHLVMPHDSLFRDQERPAKASVVLKLRHRSLAEGEPDAIRNLVASAVDGLTPDRVVVVDAAGQAPLGTKTADGLRLSAEQALEEKLISTLEPVTGAGNVRASVTLDYDCRGAGRNPGDVRSQPDGHALHAAHRADQRLRSRWPPGFRARRRMRPMPSRALPVYPQQNAPPQSAKSESGTYGASKTVRHKVESPGRVRRMTAAIVVNDRMVQAAQKGKPAQWQNRSAEELRNLTALAQAAVGFDSARGDMITVQDLPFDGNRAEPAPSPVSRVLETAESSPLLMKYAALLAAILLVMAFGVRPALRRMAAAGRNAAGGRGKGAGGRREQAALHPPEPPPVDPQRTRAQQIFEEVSGHLKREPAQSSRLLQSWIHSD